MDEYTKRLIDSLPIEERSYCHWAEGGRFRIDPTILAGQLFFELSWKGKVLGNYERPKTAVKELLAGEHDDTVGFKVSKIDLPSDPADWNGLE